jgi:hypothetical protein
LSGPSRTFTFDRPLSHPVQTYTRNSRFILYDNGAFVLKYESLGLEYRGGYSETDGEISFGWEGDGRWGASATLTGDTLTVQYNLMMTMSDFDDAVYVLVS